MAAYGLPVVAFAGMLDAANNIVESAIAQDDIAYGAPVFGYIGEDNKAYALHSDVATTLLAGDLVTSNVLTTTINGIAVAATFVDTHANQMILALSNINADTDLIALGITAVADSTHGMVITAPAGLSLVVTQVVTLGSSQTTAAVVYTTLAKFIGVAVHVMNGSKTVGAGTSLWEDGSSVNILSKGRIWVNVESTVADKDPAYAVSFGAGTAGKFTDVSTLNYDIGGYFRSTVSGGFAIVEVRGLK